MTGDSGTRARLPLLSRSMRSFQGNTSELAACTRLLVDPSARVVPTSDRQLNGNDDSDDDAAASQVPTVHVSTIAMQTHVLSSKQDQRQPARSTTKESWQTTSHHCPIEQPSDCTAPPHPSLIPSHPAWPLAHPSDDRRTFTCSSVVAFPLFCPFRDRNRLVGVGVGQHSCHQPSRNPKFLVSREMSETLSFVNPPTQVPSDRIIP
ncbi:uncharacterized protein BKA78DRAFT_301988 [Phyllosticta capitalensis]|uniref:uncharacterized protein n=1 Tax=Phyllosticta capitalensis TaxID=121624 RepID=UPI00312FB671